MKRMLINATYQEDELRIALVDGQTVYDLDIESTANKQKKANIYKGRITRVEPSLEAAFVDYGENRHGFLPLKEIAPVYYPAGYDSSKSKSIKEIIKEGQEIIVQVEKEERGNKGAALTTSITIPGSYLVLMPNNSRAGGVSRRIEGEDRHELKEILSMIEYPQEMGLIVRTASSGKSQEELQWDLDILLKHWAAIQSVQNERPAPFLIYQEGNGVIRAIRDYLRKDIDEIVIDNKEVYEDAKRHLAAVRPDFVDRIKYYDGSTPLFTRFQIESQIESAFAREVRLPSGGSIVIDHTEALISIDINSSKSTKGSDIEDTALNTNLEASREIARQLRLRDLGGLVVIDYIDMVNPNNQRSVEDALTEALAMDRARVQVGRISRFGLMEMSRQRLRPSLGESLHTVCKRCEGRGTIRGIESLALTVIRIIEEHSLKENTAAVRAQLPSDMATFILNEKRKTIVEIEQRQGITVQIIANPYMQSPQYEIERIRTHDIFYESSHKLIKKPEDEKIEVKSGAADPAAKRRAEPALKSMEIPDAPPPVSKGRKSSKKGFFKRILEALTGEEEKPKKHKKKHHSKPHHHKQRPHHHKKHPHAQSKHSQGKGPSERKNNNQQNARNDRETDEHKPSKPRRQNRRRNNNNRSGQQNDRQAQPNAQQKQKPEAKPKQDRPPQSNQTPKQNVAPKQNDIPKAKDTAKQTVNSDTNQGTDK